MAATSSSSTSSGWSYGSWSLSTESSLDLSHIDVQAQRLELARIQQEQEDHQLAEQLQNGDAPNPSTSSTNSNTSELNEFFGDWHPPEQRDAPRAARGDLEQSHVECTICFEPPNQQRFCNFCNQSVGCKGCCATWHHSNPSCPLCRHEWKGQPSVHREVENQRRQRRRRANF